MMHVFNMQYSAYLCYTHSAVQFCQHRGFVVDFH